VHHPVKRSAAGATTHGPASRRTRPGAFAAGLVATVIAIFMLPSSLRPLVTAMTRSGFGADQLRLESFRDPLGRSVGGTILSGQIVSSGEPLSTRRTSIVGLDRLRELNRAGTIEGHLVPVYYYPPGGLSSAVDAILEFRVLSPEEFEGGVPFGYLAVNVAFVAAGWWFVRRGIGARQV